MLAGAAWDTKQKVQQAKKMVGDTSLAPRSDVVVECAMGRLDGPFRRELDFLMSQKVFWQDLIPGINRNMNLKAMSFRMLSTA